MPAERIGGWGRRRNLEQDIRRISDAKLWQFRTDTSKSLVEFARDRLWRQLASSGLRPKRSNAPNISSIQPF